MYIASISLFQIVVPAVRDESLTLMFGLVGAHGLGAKEPKDQTENIISDGQVTRPQGRPLGIVHQLDS